MMKKLLAGIFTILTLGGYHLSAQNPRTTITSGATLPANCTADANIYGKTGSNAGFYFCTATNTWSLISPGAASPDTSIQFNNGGAFGGSSSLEWDGSHMTIDIGHATSLINSIVGVSVLADDNTDPSDSGINLATLNSTSFFTMIRGNGTLGTPTPAVAGNIIGDLSFNALTSTGDYSANIQSVEVQGKVDPNASGSVKAGLFAVFTRGNDDAMHAMFVTGVAETDINSIGGASGSGNPGKPIVLTAGSGDGAGTGGNVTLTPGASGSGAVGSLLITTLPAATGHRYLCIDTAGVVTSVATSCGAGT